MTPFQAHRGRVVPLLRANVDTDVIIRMQRCASVPREELGSFAFESLRTRADGTPDAACVFNDPRFADASILLALDNFGCGSSREMAVWALAGMGLRCVLAPSFGDIFLANCFQNGLLPVSLPARTIDALARQAAGGTLELDVDLSQQLVTGAADGPIRFEIEPLRRQMLLRGLDEISLSLTRADDITHWQERDRAERPWVHLPLRM